MTELPNPDGFIVGYLVGVHPELITELYDLAADRETPASVRITAARRAKEAREFHEVTR